MKKHIIKSLLFIVTVALFASCNGDLSKKLEDKLLELDSKTESLDSIVNKEMNRVRNLDSIINFESDKIKKLDSVITESASKIDSMAGGKIELLKEIIK
ncbi:MAG: hypothetical protein ACTIJ9_10515 [Aequorivita sp.]